ncbi:hypothetical protein LDENG_00001340 [Lucifuga dentata]|nr:hypothetical protein LDENG_00001340 [Lucifuga dentata]
MSVTLFFAPDSTVAIKKKQTRILNVLSSKKINYTIVNITVSSEKRDLMRKIAGDPKALPPQIANGDVYCGDFDAFDNAIETEDLETFLKL